MAILNERRYQFPIIFRNASTEIENLIICVSGLGHDVFRCQNGKSYCGIQVLECRERRYAMFPVYTYSQDGTNRRENITDRALEQFRTNYADDSITKWNIFYYVYPLLHHPLYRNLSDPTLRTSEWSESSQNGE